MHACCEQRVACARDKTGARSTLTFHVCIYGFFAHIDYDVIPCKAVDTEVFRNEPRLRQGSELALEQPSGCTAELCACHACICLGHTTYIDMRVVAHTVWPTPWCATCVTSVRKTSPSGARFQAPLFHLSCCHAVMSKGCTG